MNDDQLHQLLRAAPARASLPSSFNREVWARIESEESPSLSGALSQLWQACLGMLSRPLAAFAVVAFCMLLGGGFGWASQRSASSAGSELAYAASINPFLQVKNEVAQ